MRSSGSGRKRDRLPNEILQYHIYIFFNFFKVSYTALWPSLEGVGEASLANMDQTSGILQVWYLLLEGLAGATMTCPRRYQPQALDTLFSLLRSLPDCPGKTSTSDKNMWTVKAANWHSAINFIIHYNLNRKYLWLRLYETFQVRCLACIV